MAKVETSTPIDTSPSTSRDIVPFLILGAAFLCVVISVIIVSMRRRLRQPREPEEIEPAPRRLRPDVVRLLDAVVPSAVLRTDGAQCPSRDGRSETVCVICLDKLAEGTMVRHLPCRHLFHTSCIDQWFRSQRYTCPICIAPYFVVPSQQLPIPPPSHLPLSSPGDGEPGIGSLDPRS